MGVSHPVRGAWIEMKTDSHIESILEASHPVRGPWIEICSVNTNDLLNIIMSHPVRGAWIEIHEGRVRRKNGRRRIP